MLATCVWCFLFFTHSVEGIILRTRVILSWILPSRRKQLHQHQVFSLSLHFGEYNWLKDGRKRQKKVYLKRTYPTEFRYCYYLGIFFLKEIWRDEQEHAWLSQLTWKFYENSIGHDSLHLICGVYKNGFYNFTSTVRISYFLGVVFHFQLAKFGDSHLPWLRHKWCGVRKDSRTSKKWYNCPF